MTLLKVFYLYFKLFNAIVDKFTILNKISFNSYEQ